MNSLLLAYYGDDFTGSTDVLELLASAGVHSRLYLEPPTTSEINGHDPPLRAVGVAGSSRSMTPDEMNQALPALFARLAELNSKVVHYKVCSTFDSAPELGSIGRAIELGLAVFKPRFVPLVVAAPRLGRYSAFGNLFARAGLDSEVFRLDRHPGVIAHPSTPMDEADIRLHLAKQTSLPVELIDITEVEIGSEHTRRLLHVAMADRSPIVLIDLIHERQLASVGELILDHRPAFVAGSAGVEEALIAHWLERGLLINGGELPTVGPARHVVAVSGSASPVTSGQIDEALACGFREIPADTAKLVDPERADFERRSLVARVLAELRDGTSVIVHTARGPQDPRLRRSQRDAASAREVSLRLGRQLGLLLRDVHDSHGLDRAVIVGGDTSAHAVRAMGVVSLEAIAVSAPGAPLCRVSAPHTSLHGIEVVLKGGQIGTRSYLNDILEGGR